MKNKLAVAAAIACATGLLSPAPSLAGPDRIVRDARGDAPESVDLTSVRTSDGERPAIVVKARAIPRQGSAKIDFYDWENRYELRLVKGQGVKKTLRFVNEETGDKTKFTCDYAVRWGRTQIKVTFRRNSCFYEEEGDQYTGFSPYKVKLASETASDVAGPR